VTGVAAKKTVATSEVRRRYLDDPRRMEIRHGELRAAPTPTAGHQRVAGRVFALLDGASRTGSLADWGFLRADIELRHEPEEVRAPDVVGYRVSRWRDEWDDVVPIPEAPDWLCEVWSPSNTMDDREELMRVYFASPAVEYVWTIDRATETLKVFRRGATTWRRARVIEDVGEVFTAEPFAGVTMTLRGLLRLR
jgi:Uma2 family endonuclease